MNEISAQIKALPGYAAEHLKPFAAASGLYSRHSLSFRVLKRGILSVMLVIVGISLPMYVLEMYQGRNEIRKKSGQVSYRISNTFGMPFWSLDDRMMDSLMRLELEDPDVAGIRVYHESEDFYGGLYEDSSGHIMASTGSSDENKELAKNFLKTTAKMQMDGRIFGSAEIYFTDRNFKWMMYLRILNVMILIIGVTAITFYVTLRILRKNVIRPIEILSRVVENFGKNNFSVRAPVLSRDELGNLSSHINDMADTIQQYNESLEQMVEDRTLQLVSAEKMAALGELVAGISHEINTPVGTAVTAASFIELNTRLMLEKAMTSDLRKTELIEYLQNSEEAMLLTMANLNRASELIQSFKRIASDRKSAERRTFNVYEYIGDVIMSLRPRIKKTRHEIVVDCPEDLSIESYPGEISQILTNFIMNSLIHAFSPDEAGKITVHVHREGHMIVMVYSDNGIGIPADNISRIFNPFFTTKRGSGGSGLGLNIVHNIVTQTLGGSIECSSLPGQGTSFTILFPDMSSDA